MNFFTRVNHSVKTFHLQKKSLRESLTDLKRQERKIIIYHLIRGGKNDDYWIDRTYNLKYVEKILDEELIGNDCVMCDDFYVEDNDTENYNVCDKLFVDYDNHKTILCEFCQRIVFSELNDLVNRLQERLRIEFCLCNMFDMFKKTTIFSSIMEGIEFERETIKG